ncbi:MAG: HIT domain-containing protein [Methanocalculus sp.]|uniref:HIT family protein n=1 Tax=Methanocalculus sp. TaxID=2004547 RepID=UPI0027191002|nr:HIT domain-containing protein [Methanocalculus sp.]MDO9540086.1 HIT domain-containing protein [Methanocalculus sp.]
MASSFEAAGDEGAALLSLVHDGRRLLDEHYAPDGYTIGVNRGGAAGQSVIHLHAIPRYVGDMEELKGRGPGGDSGEEGVLINGNRRRGVLS